MVTGEKVFGVVGEAEQARPFGGISRLEIEGMEVIGIGGTVAKVVNIGQHAVLEALVRIVSHAGQNAERPTGAYFAFLLFGFGFFVALHRRGVAVSCVNGENAHQKGNSQGEGNFFCHICSL